eukprot:tig00020912_g15807.t1
MGSLGNLEEPARNAPGYSHKVKVTFLGGNLGSIVEATTDIGEGETIFSLSGLPIVPINSKYAITISNGRYWDPTGTDCAFMNHSCDPSTAFDFKTLTFYARRPIKAGGELTFNYLTTEYTMECPFDCECKATHCFKRVAGFKNCSKEQAELLTKVGLTTSPHFQTWESSQ